MTSARIIGMDAARTKLTRLERNTRFALSRGINDTAKDVQSETLDKTLPRAFTLRGKWQQPGSRFGFNAKFSSKSNLTATVGSRADWLKNQEEGGTKTAGTHRVAVPTPEHKPVAQKMTRDKKPRALLAHIGKLTAEKAKIDQQRKSTGRYDKGEYKSITRNLRSAKLALKHQGEGSQAFLLTTKSGFTGIFKRVVRKLVLLFSLVKSARISPVLKFREASRFLVNEKFDAHFTKRLKEALK